jgi:DNA repair protein SbcC/Rad50
VKPLRLEIEGFTSFRESTVLELEGLDLFAITGPTGAGKSSLIDALVFALYGQVPRVGREYKQLLSHGSERLSVRLDFEVGGQRYRIARTARVKGTPQVRLERIVGDDAQPLADRVSEIEEQVERIVGLDYDAFTRSVVLPQGQFDRFLTGKPEERRKILIALLDLGVYEQMQRIANQRASEARREAEYIDRQLKADFANATPAAVDACEIALAASKAAATRLCGLEQHLESGIEAAQTLRSARRELHTLCQEARREAQRLAEATRLLETAAGERGPLEAKLSEARRRAVALAFDPQRHVVLLSARVRVEELVRVTTRAEQHAGRRSETAARLDQARAGCRAAETAIPLRQAAAEAAEEALRAARLLRERLQAQHAAHALRPQLVSGAACPVCEQEVARLPKSSKLPALDRASAFERDAERALEGARREHEQARLAHERAKATLEGLEREHEQLADRQSEEEAGRQTLRDGLAADGFAVAQPADLLAEVQCDLAALEAARAERERFEAEAKRHESACAEIERRTAVAQSQVEDAGRRIAELRTREQTAVGAVARGEAALRALAQDTEWELPSAPREGDDEAAALEKQRALLQRQAQSTAAAVARLEAELRQLGERVTRAQELAAQRQRLQATATLAADLASELRADQFVAYVQEEALQILAQDGSRHLEGLSQGRYALVCESQEFSVVDRWNADQQRSVRTLSGGETFLASLALALALAESLARLSAEGRHAEALDSLFLDEGFGSLDADTLDTVVDALDALHGGRRMVGIVTHIQDLAQRLPARVEVTRGAKSASVRVV